VQGQTQKEARSALKKVASLEQIDDLKNKHPDWTIREDKTLLSDSALFPEIIKANIGEIVLKQYNPKAPTFIMKILDEREVELCKVKYIYLDGSKLSLNEVDSLRALIIHRYNSGDEFEELVRTYTMDGNPTGDLGWFSKGMMVDTFDNAVRLRKKGEIFTVDVEQNKWYYVVLKNYDNRNELAKISIKIQYEK
jgi:hypothetical protein